MGIILSVKLIHLDDDRTLVTPVQDLVTARKFFGDDFAKAAGNRRFATRRANKAYLQGIELTAENEQLKTKFEMLGAIVPFALYDEVKTALTVAEEKLQAISKADGGDGEDF